MIQLTTELSLNNSFLFVLLQDHMQSILTSPVCSSYPSSNTSSMKLLMLGFTVLMQFFCVCCLVNIIIFRLYA